MIPLLLAAVLAQNFDQRGFIENSTVTYPQTAPNDSGHLVDLILLRWEVSYSVTPWLKLSGGFDAETDSHLQVGRSWNPDWDGRTIRRPALSPRRYSATLHMGKFTAELGRQFIRWGETDILNPTDRFAPKDYLTNVVSPDYLGVIAVRATVESGSNTYDLVWQPRFTPSRIPLLLQRWAAIPPEAEGVALEDLGASYPGGSEYGARWKHMGPGYEYSFSFFDGFNYFPLLSATFDPATSAIGVQRYYPELRLYGADAAVPLSWFTIKGEAAYFTSSTPGAGEYLLYVVQLERQVGEWSLVGGYAGEEVTRTGDALQFSPDVGFARSFVGRAGWTIDPARSLSVQAVARARGSYTDFEYSQTFGQHWRGTADLGWIRGDMSDFLGQYHRNSYASLAVRYSF
jgi:hypothetical protein